MNKILLLLIIVSGFLVIFYANSDIFTRKTFLFNVFHSKSGGQNDDDPTKSPSTKIPALANKIQSNNINIEELRSPYLKQSLNHRKHDSTSVHIKKIKYHPRENETEYNIFIIYTKENYQLQKKFELFAKSLLKYTTVKVHLHIITDSKSEQTAEELLKQQVHRYHKSIYYTLYDVHECAQKISDIVENLMPFFSSNPSSYYSDALFFLSLGLNRIADDRMTNAILLDCDVVFRSDVRLLFDEFNKFNSENLFGLAPELTPVYRHILYRYRANYPHTNFGSPYYLNLYHNDMKDGRKHLKHSGKHGKHGYPGLNSGIVLLNLKRIRNSKLYLNNLNEEYVAKLTYKYSFKGHLGDQDFYTLLGYEFPSLIYRLDCIWNRQLCTWWKDHGYSDVFDQYFRCDGKVKIYHGNCNTRIPE